MKMDEKGRLWLVFCAAAVCGLLLPGWIGAAGIPGMELADPAAMQGWTVLDDWRGKLAAGLLKSRLLPALVLYFAAFTAAGFWMLAGGLSDLRPFPLGFCCPCLPCRWDGWGCFSWPAPCFPSGCLRHGRKQDRRPGETKEGTGGSVPGGPGPRQQMENRQGFSGHRGSRLLRDRIGDAAEPAFAAAVPEIQLINLRKQLDSFALYDIFIPERQRFVVQNIQKQLFRETERRVKDVNTT